MGMVLVCGSREWDDYLAILGRLSEFVDQEVVLHGDATGADKLTGKACRELGLDCFAFPPDYDRHGKTAPHVRNDLMLSQADRVIAFWDGRSRGTKSVIEKAKKRGLEVEVISA